MRFNALFKILFVLVFVCLYLQFAVAQDMVGGPWDDAHWVSAGKQGLGTSATLESQFRLNLKSKPHRRSEDGAKGFVAAGQYRTEDIDSNGFECGKNASRLLSGASVSDFPVIEDGSIIFTFKGTSSMVEIAGDFTRWKSRGLKFRDVPGTEYKCFQMKFGPTARIEYKLIVDGEWITDPLNPKKIDNGVGGENSVVEMPGYVPTKWDRDFDSTLFGGINELAVKSAKFGDRKVKIYIPTEYFKRGIAPKLPVLYLQDGSEYIKRAKAINILENLTASREIEPFMIVFIDPVDRMKEYWANDDWADFMALEVVPAVEGKYFTTIKSGRENRALLGASLGGITSFWTAIKHPGVFGRIGAQSASFWVDNERVVKSLEKLDREKFDFTIYLDDGRFEGVDDSQRVVKMLKKRGFKVTYIERETGHNWTSWRDRLESAYRGLWK